MHPSFRAAVSLATLGAFAVSVGDNGLTGKPPANAVGQLLAAASTTATTSTLVVQAVTGQAYDVQIVRPLTITLP
jgi:hypothetical protein